MKVAVLTSDKDRHLYFAQQVCDVYPESIVVCQQKGVEIAKPPALPTRVFRKAKRVHKKLWEKAQALPNLKAYEQARLQLRQEKSEAEKKYFAEAARQYLASYQDQTYFIQVTINHPWVESLLKHVQPDVICVMGTALVKENIYSVAPYCLNLHTGISPKYRGGASNLWPFIFQEPQYIGATVHLISSKIDGGDIVYRGRPSIEKGDSFGSLNSKSIMVGAELMVQALKDVESKSLQSQKQEMGGHLLLSKHLKLSTPYDYYQQLNAGLLDRYLQNPEQFPVDPGIQFATHPNQK